MPTSLGPAEILVILVVALIVLGPSKLPEAGRQVGKALAEVRKWSQGFQDEIRATIDPEAGPPSYSQPQPGYVPPSPPAVDAAPSPVETNGSSVTTGSHGLISGPAPAPAPAPVDPAPAAPTEPPTGDAPAT